ncbi:hypothetical protein K491DRAFT_695151 [Lophiostoma macrostomum CBS 122681]|uniref:F-box domain-containing protein n=1 Tax=Lophiostoma macrostomum CBS 122681 TaxID=1314788 RepID=A0A6A6T1F8_9PLEO|nr:hypothetical protein K491DRAFT_695151 [Lophiostoma macrostomum CBS 122681]
MAGELDGDKPSPIGLLTLPNELLIEIASPLRTPDARRLGKVSRRLRFFVEDYLARYRYNAGLFTLPNELMLEIAQHLTTQKDRSWLARASQRLYPLIMDCIFRYDVRYSMSSLLIYAAKRNLKNMAQKILHLGGDVNTQVGVGTRFLGNRLTPLATAAYHGHERMVNMFLNSGASHFVNILRIPLATAMLNRHETVSLVLSRTLESSDVPLTRERGTVLQMACVAKLVNLVRFHLEKESRRGGRIDVQSLRNRSSALYQILKKDASIDDIIKRQLHEDTYQIVFMLLEHGADPDVQFGTKSSHPVTARSVASRHPDPRVRNKLLKASPVTESKECASHIGRPWIASQNETLKPCQARSEALRSEVSRHTTLWDFLSKSGAEMRTFKNEELSGVRETDDEGYPLNALILAKVPQPELEDVKKKSELKKPPPLSSYPQLRATEVCAQHDAGTSLAHRVRNEVKQSSRSAEDESSSLLNQSKMIPKENRNVSWASIHKDHGSWGRDATRITSPADIGQPAYRSSKKTKWKPLSLKD